MLLLILQKKYYQIQNSRVRKLSLGFFYCCFKRFFFFFFPCEGASGRALTKRLISRSTAPPIVERYSSSMQRGMAKPNSF